MQENKTSVRKMGDIHIVYMDLVSGKPMKLSSAQDSPEFGFPQTFNSRQELNRAMPGHIFEVFEEQAKSSQALAKASPEIDAQVAAILGGNKAVNKQEPAAAPAASSPKLLVPLSRNLVEERAATLIQKLEFAAQYASSKNKKEIQVKIATLMEAFNELFS